MKKTFKILIITCMFWILTLMCSSVHAASASISASSTSVTVGKKVTITVTIKAAAWNLSVSGSASGSIVGYSDDGANTTTTKTYSFTPSSAGTYTVKLSGDVTDGSTDKESDISKSVTVTAKKSSDDGGSSNSTKSSDATLKMLGVTPSTYDFTGFSRTTYEYKVTVPNSVTKLSVYATTNNSKATYSVSGNSGFSVGTNIIKVTVKAEDGTTKTYKIYVTRQAEEEETISNKQDNEDESEAESESDSDSEEDGIVIGLESLSVEGYELNSEFNTSVLDYKVEIGDTRYEDLDELKELINAVSNYESAEAIITVEEPEEETYYLYLATITVADDEKEYASYSIKFVESLEAVAEIEEEETLLPEDAEAAERETSDDEESDSFLSKILSMLGLSDLDEDVVKNWIVIVCVIIIVLIAIILGIIAYDKSKKLKKYQEKEIEAEENDLYESPNDTEDADILEDEKNISDLENTEDMEANELNEDNVAETNENKEVNLNNNDNINEKMANMELTGDARELAKNTEDELQESENEKKEEYNNIKKQEDNSSKYAPKYSNKRSRGKKGGRHF